MPPRPHGHGPGRPYGHGPGGPHHGGARPHGPHIGPRPPIGAFIIRPGPIGPHRRCGMYGWPICFLLCPFLLLISLGLAAIDYMCTGRNCTLYDGIFVFGLFLFFFSLSIFVSRQFSAREALERAPFLREEETASTPVTAEAHAVYDENVTYVPPAASAPNQKDLYANSV